MLQICLLQFQIIESFYEIYHLAYIYMYIKNILETNSSDLVEIFSLRDQKKISLFLFLLFFSL